MSLRRLITTITCSLLGVAACSSELWSQAQDPPKLSRADLQKKVANLSSRWAMERWSADPMQKAKLLKELTDAKRELVPEGDAWQPWLLQELAIALSYTARATEAVAPAREAVKITRRLHPQEKYPRGLQEIAAALDNLGTVLGVAGKLDESEATLRESITCYERFFASGAYPDGSGDLATVLDHLAFCLQEREKLLEAEGIHRRALKMRRRLAEVKNALGPEDLALSLNNLASNLRLQGRYIEAEPLLRESYELARRMQPTGKSFTMKTNTTHVLFNLATTLHEQGRYGEAEKLLRQAVHEHEASYPPERFPKSHPDVALGHSELGILLSELGRLSEAEKELRIAQKIYRDNYGPPSVALQDDYAANLISLGNVLVRLHQTQAAEEVLQDVLAMTRRMSAGISRTAHALSNLAHCHEQRGQRDEARRSYEEALRLRRGLYPASEYPNGHHEVAKSLDNCSRVQWHDGRSHEAESYAVEALAMWRSLYPREQYRLGHPDLASGLVTLGSVHSSEGKWDVAAPLLAEALESTYGLIVRYAEESSFGNVLMLAGSLQEARNLYLSLDGTGGPAVEYDLVWKTRAALTRVEEQRRLVVRAAARGQPSLLPALHHARRERSELVYGRLLRDPVTRAARQTRIVELNQRIAQFEEDARRAVPDFERAKRVAGSRPADLQKALPRGTVFVDLVYYVRYYRDVKKRGKAGDTYTAHYHAFVTSRDGVGSVPLGPAEPIEKVLEPWLAGVSDPGLEAADDLSLALRRRLWEPIEKAMPAGTTTVYLAPDHTLCFLPWAALPGRKPGTVLLEEYALATVPHGCFLLESRGDPRERGQRPEGLLSLGGVAYDDLPPAEALAAPPRRAHRQSRAAMLPAEGKAMRWEYLGGSKREAEALAELASQTKLPVRTLSGTTATSTALLAELPRARFAHLATHGFFLDSEIRAGLQTDPKLFETRGNERIGPGALNPLLKSGLVCAGANKPETAGRGLLTGEQLIDLDLTGLDLAVLSACDTGLGETSSGEGVFGLQRSFHLAGCQNVVASLWKVNDTSTAVLMKEFYRNLWTRNLAPLDALRQAQLAIYRDPMSYPELRAIQKAGPGARLHPSNWAAFSFSGTGR